MEDWTRKRDDDLFAAHEMPNSQMSYWRETEIKRRLYLMQKENLEQQARAISAQEGATAEMKRQSTIMMWSVVGIFATAVITALVAIFT